MMQGDLADLKAYSSATYSETAARLNNLFNAPSPVEVDGRFLETGLIHKTRKGITVRSKSELIIADLLFSKQADFQYEHPLIAADGSWRSATRHHSQATVSPSLRAARLHPSHIEQELQALAAHITQRAPCAPV